MDMRGSLETLKLSGGFEAPNQIFEIVGGHLSVLKDRVGDDFFV